MKRLLPRPAPIRKRPSRAKPKPAPAAPHGQPAQDPPAPGQATHASRHNQPEPQLPHEQDQSSSSQARAGEQDPHVAHQAAADVRRGLVDTDRGPVLERLQRDHFEPANEPVSSDPPRTPGDEPVPR